MYKNIEQFNKTIKSIRYEGDKLVVLCSPHEYTLVLGRWMKRKTAGTSTSYVPISPGLARHISLWSSQFVDENITRFPE